MRPRSGTATRHLPTSPFVREVVAPATTEGFEVGDRVTTDKMGMGRVVAVTEEFVVVDFGTGKPCAVAPGTRGLARL